MLICRIYSIGHTGGPFQKIVVIDMPWVVWALKFAAVVPHPYAAKCDWQANLGMGMARSRPIVARTPTVFMAVSFRVTWLDERPFIQGGVL